MKILATTLNRQCIWSPGKLLFLLTALLLLCRPVFPAAHTTPVETIVTRNPAHSLQQNVDMSHWHKHQMYLRTLNDLHSAVEKELAVVKLMQTCETMGVRCTGWGIMHTTLHQEVKAKDEKARQAKNPQRTEQNARRLLPEVLAVYQGHAKLNYGGRYYEVGSGDRVGGYRVERIEIDSVVLGKAGNNYVLPIPWRPSGSARRNTGRTAVKTK